MAALEHTPVLCCGQAVMVPDGGLAYCPDCGARHLDPDAAVWLSSSWGGASGRRRVHSDPDCHLLQQAGSPRDKLPSMLADDAVPCPECGPDE